MERLIRSGPINRTLYIVVFSKHWRIILSFAGVSLFVGPVAGDAGTFRREIVGK